MGWLMKYLVISSDKEIFELFEKSIGVAPLKMSSVTAAKTMITPKNVKFDFAVMDELKGIEELAKLLKKKKIPYFIIGEHLEKPVTSEQIKQLVSNLTDSNKPKSNKSNLKTIKDDKQEKSTVIDQKDNKPLEKNEPVTIVEKVLNSEIEPLKEINEEIKTEDEIKDTLVINKEDQQEQFIKNTDEQILHELEEGYKEESQILDEVAVTNVDNEMLKDLEDIFSSPKTPKENNEVEIDLDSKQGNNKPDDVNNSSWIKNLLDNKTEVEPNVVEPKRVKKSKGSNEPSLIGNLISNTKKALVENKNKQINNPQFIHQQVIAINRVKGGVGATTLAIALASYLNSNNIKTCLMDLNFLDGGSDLSYYLDLPLLPHWSAFKNNPTKEGFQEALESFNGIGIIQSPPATHLVSDLTSDLICKAINYAKKQYTIIILDLPNENNPIIKDVINQVATTSILVSGGNLSEMKRLEQLRQQIEVDNEILVLNNCTDKLKSKFKNFLEIENIISIPEDPEVLNNLEKRKFVFSKESNFNNGLSELVNKILNI